MKTRALGNLIVSEVGMGCMGFSHGYGKVPPTEYAIEAIHKAHDYGCTLFDTAEGYGGEMFYPGHNEEIVGKAIKSFRKDVVLATKLHIPTDEYNNTSAYEVLAKHLDHSLENLQTDYVDLYYLHRLNEDVPLAEVAEAFGRLIREGKIRGWGLSQIGVDTLKEAHSITPVSAVQNLYSMMERDSEQDVIPYCENHGIGFVPFSPTSSGFLSGKVTSSTKFEGDDVRKWVPQLSQENIIANQPLLILLQKYAQEIGASMAQISLAWMLHKYENVVPIPGSKNQERILENLSSSEVAFTNEEFTKLEQELNACTIHGHRGQIETQKTTFGNHWKK